MITGEDLLHRIADTFQGEAKQHFRYPFILVEVQSQAFAGKDDEERESELAARCGFPESDLRQSLDRLFIRLQLRAPEEPPSLRPDEGQFWLRSLAESVSPKPETVIKVSAVHFYGYKGGQARSTVLAFLSSILATNGWRVLVIDADAEAPSADIIFRANVAAPEATLVGLRSGLSLSPLRVIPGTGRGFVNLLAFRPMDTRYDIDAAALAMEQSLAPTALAKMAANVADFAKGGYDIVFIDHRTGLSPTVLPWVSDFPGPIVVFARLDEQWKPARPHLRALWRMAGEDPGVIGVV